MRSDHLVDPETRATLEHPTDTYTQANLAEMRAKLGAYLDALPSPNSATVEIEEITVPGAWGCPDVGLRILRPKTSPARAPAIFHVHGGGYVTCEPRHMDFINVPLAARLGCPIFSVAYRLAPEAPHPAPITDCYAALRWLWRHGRELNIDPDRIGLKGESAGAGLVAALALLARDRGEVPLLFQHMLAPMLDDRTVTRPDPHPLTGEFAWTAQSNCFAWRSLLGAEPGSAGVSCYAAAARAEDLSGLPPAFIAVGALDLFLEEDVEYARRLTRAGVHVELHVYPGVHHGSAAAAEARVVKQMERDSLQALEVALFRS